MESLEKTKSKKIVDPDDDDWKCKNCGCPAKHTPLKRTGRDGKKSICNACYIRERTQQERAERGSARPVLTTTVPMTTANILSNPQQNYFLPYWNLANLSMVQQQMNMLTKLGQLGIDNQQLYANNPFGNLTQDTVSAAIQAYQAAATAAAAATASGQLPVDYNSNLNMLGALGTLGLTAAATTQAAEAANVLSGQDIEQSVQDIQQSDLSEEIKTEDESSKQDLQSVQQQIQQITSTGISDITSLAAAVADADTIDKLNKTTALLTESLYDQQAVTAAAVAALDQQLKNDELIKEKINKEIKSLQEAQLRKTEESSPKVELKEEKKIYQKRKEMDEEDNLLGEKIKKELKRVKVDSK
ncbi:hypothetical protein PIROE2DRAFT_64102 [Piromyces sp. E2]|nr:hypothetical protein PIROE2DRAFT_64102 [Piromyces sp. E2]|eukprot:OUM58930.1 hypothetical protein PIROE2DRAFT_64102 [Piromyces sp. E2]